MLLKDTRAAEAVIEPKPVGLMTAAALWILSSDGNSRHPCVNFGTSTAGLCRQIALCL